MTELSPERPNPAPAADPGDGAGRLQVDDDPIIGIDLGTTNSLAAYCDEAGPRILHDQSGQPMLPSVVRIDPESGAMTAIGLEARRTAVEHPESTIYSVKRLMGRSRDDLSDEVARLAYEVVEGEHRTARVRVSRHVLAPQQISAMILAELRRRAERALGTTVRRAVITVPAYFDDAQRQATRDAAQIAGLNVLRLVNEPTAAALAYNLGRSASKTSQHDDAHSQAGSKLSLSPAKPSLAGGLKIVGQGPEASECQSNDQADGAESDHTSGPSVQRGAAAHSQHAEAEGQTVAVFDLGGGTFDISILRLEQTDAGVVDQVLATAGDTHLGGDDVDQMLIDLVQQEIREQFSQAIDFPPATRQAFRNLAEAAKIRLSSEDQASIEVALPDDADGQPRIYQRTITRAQLETLASPWLDRALDCCARAISSAGLGVAEIDRVVMVGGSTRIPMVRQRVATFFKTVPYTALDPDQVVAMGAAVQASILAGRRQDTLLLDVIPLSLGIETMGGAVAKLIVANTTIPTRATEMFTTHAEGQTNVAIHIVQGERELVSDCRSLGRFELRGIPPMPAGLPKIEVTFTVDANGLLSVEAVEKRSEVRARVQIVPNHGLTRDEVGRMTTEGFAHAREDMDAHRLIDLRNQARLDIRQIRRQLEKVGQQLQPDERQHIEAHLETVEGFLRAPKPDADEFYKALDAMDKATIRLAELAVQRALAGGD